VADKLPQQQHGQAAGEVEQDMTGVTLARRHAAIYGVYGAIYRQAEAAHA